MRQQVTLVITVDVAITSLQVIERKEGNQPSASYHASQGAPSSDASKSIGWTNIDNVKNVQVLSEIVEDMAKTIIGATLPRCVTCERMRAEYIALHGLASQLIEIEGSAV